MSKKRKSAVKLAGTVEKIIPEQFSSEPEKAEIAVDTADPLYREIRIENKLQDENGDEVALKPGAQVDVIIEAEPEATDQKGLESPIRPDARKIRKPKEATAKAATVNVSRRSPAS